MANAGAIGTAPLAAFPLGAAYQSSSGIGSASGTATVLGVGAGLSTVGVGSATGYSTATAVSAAIANAVAAAIGSSSASGVGIGSIATYGALGTSPVAASPTAGGSLPFAPTGYAYGTSTASGIIEAVVKAIASAAGDATVSGVGNAAVQAAANASGSASVTGVGLQAGIGVGSATGSSYVYAVAILVPSVATATGSSTAYAYSPRVVGTASGEAIVNGASPTTYQVGVGFAAGTSTAIGYFQGNQAAIGFAAGTSTANFRSASNSTFTAFGTSTADAAGTFSTSGFTPPPPFFYSFTPGPTGKYIEPPFIGNVCACQDCSPPTPAPTPPNSFTWKATPLTNARVCDITWVGNRIIVGRAGSLWGGDSSVYLSANTGKTWSKLPIAPDNWVSVTMSASGAQCAAYPLDTQVTYVSNDLAANWTSYPRPWGASQTNAAEISDDGTITIVTANPGNLIYLSNNNGVSWTGKNNGLTPFYEFYTASCLSSNGSTMFAGRSLDKMHRSLNSGSLWAVCNNSFASQFSKVACSGDGNIVLATSQSVTGWLQVSRDAGVTWTKGGVNPADNTDGWNCCAVSTDGRVMAVGKYGGRLDVSFDFGVTWVTQDVDGHFGTYLWTDIGINYDGTVIVACAVNGPLYIGTAA